MFILEVEVPSSSSHNYQVSWVSEDEPKALINKAKKKIDAKIFKTKAVTKYSRAIDDHSKTTNGSSEGPKWKQ